MYERYLDSLVPHCGISGMREMKEHDIDQIYSLQIANHIKYKVHYNFTFDQVKQLLTPQENAVQTLVVENNGMITDYISYSIWDYLKNGDPFKVCELFDYVHLKTPLRNLINGMLADAQRKGMKKAQFYNAMENKMVANDKELGFVRQMNSFSNLGIYLHNYRALEVKPEEASLYLR